MDHFDRTKCKAASQHRRDSSSRVGLGYGGFNMIKLQPPVCTKSNRLNRINCIRRPSDLKQARAKSLQSRIFEIGGGRARAKRT